MTKKRVFHCLGALILLFEISNVQGQSLSSFDFLRLAPSAQVAALGGTHLTATSAQGSAVFHNPALLGKEADGNLSLSWLNHLSDLTSGTAIYARDLGKLGTAAAGIRFFHWGDLVRADQQGQRQGSFAPTNLALTVGLARPWQSRFRYGANLHLAYTSIAEFNALAMAVDVGVRLSSCRSGLYSGARCK